MNATRGERDRGPKRKKGCVPHCVSPLSTVSTSKCVPLRNELGTKNLCPIPSVGGQGGGGWVDVRVATVALVLSLLFRLQSLGHSKCTFPETSRFHRTNLLLRFAVWDRGRECPSSFLHPPAVLSPSTSEPLKGHDRDFFLVHA